MSRLDHAEPLTGAFMAGSRRSFIAVGICALPGFASPGALAGKAHWRPVARAAQLLSDIAACYRAQYFGFDLEDVNQVLSNVINPTIGIGKGTGHDRMQISTRAALADAGRIGDHVLITVALPAGEARLKDFASAYRTIRDTISPEAFAIYGGYEDLSLSPGSARVCTLIG